MATGNVIDLSQDEVSLEALVATQEQFTHAILGLAARIKMQKHLQALDAGKEIGALRAIDKALVDRALGTLNKLVELDLHPIDQEMLINLFIDVARKAPGERLDD